MDHYVLASESIKLVHVKQYVKRPVQMAFQHAAQVKHLHAQLVI
jgi:hypothetical protein